MNRHLFLIGYRGSGKSSVGKLLAKELCFSFLDTDDWVETQAGSSIREIFARIGEAGFRELESQAIAAASKLSTSHVIALGGGAILRESNRDCIKQAGSTIWLQASPGLLADRIAADKTTNARRPALTNLPSLHEIQKVLRDRTPLYEATADATIQTDAKSLVEIVNEAKGWYENQPSHSLQNRS